MYLADDPYSLPEALIGLTFLPIGLGMIAGSVLGGMLADYGAQRYAKVIEGRMLFAVVGMFLEVVGGAMFGWCLDQQQPLVFALLCHTILGIGQVACMTGSVSYFPVLRPENVGGVMAVCQSFCVLLAALFVGITPALSDAIG